MPDGQWLRDARRITAAAVREMAGACGFELAGVTPAAPIGDRDWYRQWTQAGFAGEMSEGDDLILRQPVLLARCLVADSRLLAGPFWGGLFDHRLSTYRIKIRWPLI